MPPRSRSKWMPGAWPDMKRRFADLFRTKTRAEWEQVFAGTDACVSPVLSPVEAAENPHARSRGSFSDAGGVLQPAPAPRFSRTPAALFRAAVHARCGHE